MKTSFDDMFADKYPTLDLHGEIRDSARVLIKAFLYDNYLLKNKKLLIIHGKGTGALKDEVKKELRINKYVEEFHSNMFNDGCMVVYLKERKPNEKKNCGGMF